VELVTGSKASGNFVFKEAIFYNNDESIRVESGDIEAVLDGGVINQLVVKHSSKLKLSSAVSATISPTAKIRVESVQNGDIRLSKDVVLDIGGVFESLYLVAPISNKRADLVAEALAFVPIGSFDYISIVATDIRLDLSQITSLNKLTTIGSLSYLQMNESISISKHVHISELLSSANFTDCADVYIGMILSSTQSGVPLLTITNSRVSIDDGNCGQIKINGKSKLVIDTLKIVTPQQYSITQDNPTDKIVKVMQLWSNKDIDPAVVNSIKLPDINIDEGVE
jgi:hypothetical protein